MLYYIFHVTFPPAATACYRFLAGLFGVPYTNTNEAALQILYPNNLPLMAYNPVKLSNILLDVTSILCE